VLDSSARQGARVYGASWVRPLLPPAADGSGHAAGLYGRGHAASRTRSPEDCYLRTVNLACRTRTAGHPWRTDESTTARSDEHAVLDA
jgi:hypothetical protein